MVPFAVTQVGSWPRSREVLKALRARQRGELSREAFEQLADAEVRRLIDLQVRAGVDVVVDGEVRRDSFYSFLTEKLDGTRLMSLDTPVAVSFWQASTALILCSLSARRISSYWS